MDYISEDMSLRDRTSLTADDITNLLELCLRTTYFSFRGEYYQQVDGAAMGSSVYPDIIHGDV